MKSWRALVTIAVVLTAFTSAGGVCTLPKPECGYPGRGDCKCLSGCTPPTSVLRGQGSGCADAGCSFGVCVVSPSCHCALPWGPRKDYYYCCSDGGNGIANWNGGGVESTTSSSGSGTPTTGEPSIIFVSPGSGASSSAGGGSIPPGARGSFFIPTGSTGPTPPTGGTSPAPPVGTDPTPPGGTGPTTTDTGTDTGEEECTAWIETYFWKTSDPKARCYRKTCEENNLKACLVKAEEASNFDAMCNSAASYETYQISSLFDDYKQFCILASDKQEFAYCFNARNNDNRCFVPCKDVAKQIEGPNYSDLEVFYRSCKGALGVACQEVCIAADNLEKAQGDLEDANKKDSTVPLENIPDYKDAVEKAAIEFEAALNRVGDLDDYPEP